METNITIPTGNRTDALLPHKKASSKQNKNEINNSEFIDNFLNTLIASLNPGDLSLDKSSIDKLSSLVLNEAKSNQGLSDLDLKQFIKNLKKELSNAKPHQLSLEDLEEIVTKLLSKSSLGILKFGKTQKGSDNQNLNSFETLLNSNTKENENALSELKGKNIISEDNIVGGKANKSNGKMEKLLLNLRKFLSKDEFSAIKKSLLAGDTNINKHIEPKAEAIQKFVSIITGKEADAKNKIDLKLANVNLDVHSQNDEIGKQLIENVNSTHNKETQSNPIKIIDGFIVSKDAEKQTQNTKPILDINNLKYEIENQNGQIKLVFDKSGENLLSKDFLKEQKKELLKQNIIKSDVTNLIDRTNTQKIDVKKADNIMKSNFVENVIKNIKLAKSGSNNVARIMLTPRHLGDITLRISMIGNSVKLHIKADKSETAEHIDRQLPLLKDRLNDNGLKVEQVIIDAPESENLTYFNQNQNKNEQGELRRQFVDSFRNLAAKEDFELSMNDVAYYNMDNPMVGYDKVGSITNV